VDITIDPRAPESPYHQIAAWLREQITSGEIAPGQPLPSEKQIGQATGCAATTVRRAIKLLRDEGIVFTVPGRGSYAAKR
jgi:DNA-binding GntR family transcriptional regulator